MGSSQRGSEGDIDKKNRGWEPNPLSLNGKIQPLKTQKPRGTTVAKKTTGRKHKIRKIHSRKLVIDDQGASRFAGLSLVDQLASRLGTWSFAQKVLPVRGGRHQRIDILKGGVAGLLSGSRGTAALEAIRQDEAVLRMMGVKSLPGGKGFWEDLAKLGEEQTLKGMHHLCARTARQVLKKLEPEDLQIEHGFIPLFGDGTLLEGSHRREGTKTISEKGSGLMWGAWMFGPMLAAHHLCGEGEGEQRALFDTLGSVLDEVVDPLGGRNDVLVLMDSLHGDGPSLERLEAERLMSIIGANKLDLVRKRLMDLPEDAWKKVPDKKRRKGLADEEVCVVYVQCEGWSQKRRVVAKRFRSEGEIIWHYSGVFSSVAPRRVGCHEETDLNYMIRIWRLYDRKMGMEDQFKDLLTDLCGHNPPCRELVRNRGYYALLALAFNLARGVDQIAGVEERRKQRKERRRHSSRLRINTLRRHLFALSGLIRVHSRQLVVRLIGGGREHLEWFDRWWQALARC